VSRFRPEQRVLFRYACGLLGTALLVSLVAHAGPRALFENVRLIGWGLVLIIALGGVSHLIKAWAWRLTLPQTARYSFLRLFGLRLVSEAIGQLGFAGVLAGEATRVTLLGSETPVDSRVLSVTLDRGLFTACGAIVTVCGITAGLVVLSLSHTLRVYASVFALVFLGTLAIAVLAVKNRWPKVIRILGKCNAQFYVPRFSDQRDLFDPAVHGQECDLDTSIDPGSLHKTH